MAVLNIEKAFLSENRSVSSFLNQSGQGLYIPLYQREYSWDSDNIEQMLEDLARGIQRVALKEIPDDSKEIRFLGTIITVVEANRNNIYPIDPQAVPSRIEKLIDGQQRVSTIALMATLLTKRLTEISNKVKQSNPIFSEVKEICDLWIDQRLLPIFSFDLGRGKPRLKPKIARGAKDYWTREDAVDVAYQSELSNYLGHFIQAYVDKTTFPCLSKDKYGATLLYKNGRRIESWLKRDVATAHEEKDDSFAPAIAIIENFNQEAIWDYDRDNLVQIIKTKDFTNNKTDAYILSELVQTLAVCHYLLDRCCFTIIQPTDDNWAFDMFQSLNATGTPLTAIETFKPTIVNTMDTASGYQFKDSDSDRYFKKVEDFLAEANNAQQKNKRTNDYLTSFFVAFEGQTISTHFSAQRQVLDRVYSDMATIDDKQQFVKRMGNYADFYKMWLNYSGKDNSCFPVIDGVSDSDLASMLILFLKSSNHKMAITILGSSYSNIAYNVTEAKAEFVKTVKAVAAFYFLWRSSYSNSGLDTTYRDFFKHHKSHDGRCSLSDVKEHIKKVLVSKEIDTFDKWKDRAKSRLKYDETGNEIIRLALLICAHDTIPDETQPGLMKPARAGASKYLSLENWISPNLKTIEHIAPQSNKGSLWSVDLYDNQTKPYNQLGNLTLLPQDLNSSAGNKSWKEKLLYYQCVAETDADKLNEVQTLASSLGISLISSSVDLLKGCHYNNHVSSISSMALDDSWNLQLVEDRTERMLEIVWNRINEWIN